ncbi:hypothetical protein ACN20G_08585 [Streptomyces sp. BI20]|uniref:hypothetical protein n=1 Tax=Streptomyces sp. BI20 TaxID=3403460 RepID=UPI003C75743B
MTPDPATLAFVESPVQLLGVLEWAHAHRTRPGPAGTLLTGVPAQPGPADPRPNPRPNAHPETRAESRVDRPGCAHAPAPPAGGESRLRIVVLPPTDPMSRGQLRRVAGLARDEGHAVTWQEARGGPGAPLKALAALLSDVRAAERLVIGDPFSRFTQLLLAAARTPDLVVVDDGTATLEFAARLAAGERLRRWHRTPAAGALGRVRELAHAPVAARALRRLTPSPAPGLPGRRSLELFTSMPVEPLPGARLTLNDFAWTRSRFGPPRLTRGTDLVGTSLVETGVLEPTHYLAAVARLAADHGAGRYFAHRRESPEKLRAVAEATGLQIVRPDLPLELIARRGPIGRTVVSFPSTVVHTLPYALAGTGVTVKVCEIDPDWLTRTASPRARGFLDDVSAGARATHGLAATGAAGAPGAG